MNARCEALTVTTIGDGRRFRLTDAAADGLLQRALDAMSHDDAPVPRSIPIAGNRQTPPMVAHALPVRRSARDLFTGASAIVVLTELGPASPPDVSVLEGLFDLTPAEARVAREIAMTRTIAEIAGKSHLSPETVRSQLKSVFIKTGTNRQQELAGLLSQAGLWF